MNVSTVSWHIIKHKRGAANGLYRHNERLPVRAHSNTNIDSNRTCNNINLKPMEGTYIQRIDKRMAEGYKGKQKPKSNAVFIVEHSVQLGGFMKNQPKEKWIEVLKVSAQLITDWFGKDNVIGSYIHLDETNPHLHIDTIPLTSDGRLSARYKYSRLKLGIFQNRFLEELQEKFPELNFNRKAKEDKLTRDGLTKDQYIQAVKKVKALDERQNKLLEKEEAFSYKEFKFNQRKAEVDKKELSLFDKEKQLELKERDLKNKAELLEQEKQRQLELIKRQYMEKLQQRQKELDDDFKRETRAMNEYYKKIYQESLNKFVDKYKRRLENGRKYVTDPLPSTYYSIARDAKDFAKKTSDDIEMEL